MSLILGIESSCDETAAAVVSDGRRVRANVIASQHDLHARYGGVVPEIASRAHMERIGPVIEQALREAEVEPAQLDAVAVGNRPGLIGSLLVGVSAAKALAWAWRRPLIGIDHVEAHLHAAALDAEPIAYPALGLVVSGGHTSLYRMGGPRKLRLLGRTIDDAVGEAYDKVASLLGLPFPGGPEVDRLAAEGDPAGVELPRPLLERGSLDFSFSGLKTAVLYQVHGRPVRRGMRPEPGPRGHALSRARRADVAASFQAAVVEVILQKLEWALEALERDGTRPRSLVIGGGVSANRALRSRVVELGPVHGLEVRIPAMCYCVDNGAMIAGFAHRHLDEGRADDLELEAAATSRR